MTHGTPAFEQQKLDLAVATLRAVAHETRLKMIRFLSQRGWVNVQQLHSNLGIEPSLASQHLRILRRANLVETRREGKLISYCLNEDRRGRISAAVETFLSGASTSAIQA